MSSIRVTKSIADWTWTCKKKKKRKEKFGQTMSRNFYPFKYSDLNSNLSSFIMFVMKIIIKRQVNNLKSFYLVLTCVLRINSFDFRCNTVYPGRNHTHTQTYSYTPGGFWKAPLRDKTGSVSPLKTSSKPQINGIY